MMEGADEPTGLWMFFISDWLLLLLNFTIQIQILRMNFIMENNIDGELGIRTRAAGWKAQTNQLGYESTSQA